jgi:hypothetical protein
VFRPPTTPAFQPAFRPPVTQHRDPNADRAVRDNQMHVQNQWRMQDQQRNRMETDRLGRETNQRMNDQMRQQHRQTLDESRRRSEEDARRAVGARPAGAGRAGPFAPPANPRAPAARRAAPPAAAPPRQPERAAAPRPAGVRVAAAAPAALPVDAIPRYMQRREGAAPADGRPGSLPFAYAEELGDGDNRVTLVNRRPTQVVVGLRSGARGRNVVLAAGKSLEVAVPDGKYTWFWLVPHSMAPAKEGGDMNLRGYSATVEIQ